MADPTSEQRTGILEYLRQQAAKRSIEEIISRVQDGVDAVAIAARLVPEDRLSELGPGEGEPWTPVDCLKHVVDWNRLCAQQILYVALSGELPEGAIRPELPETIDGLIEFQQQAIDSLFAHVRDADPDAYLYVTWEHPFFGNLNWREWLMFLRVHCLDHAPQLKALAGIPG